MKKVFSIFLAALVMLISPALTSLVKAEEQNTNAMKQDMGTPTAKPAAPAAEEEMAAEDEGAEEEDLGAADEGTPTEEAAEAPAEEAAEQVAK